MGGEAELRAQRGGELEGGATLLHLAPGAGGFRVWYGQAERGEVSARPPRCKPGLWGVRQTSRKS